MSPVALQDEAGTHFPPWQFVEQHWVLGTPSVQAFPSVVQVAVLPAVVMATHCPPVHIPEQHCDAEEQVWPVEAQAPLAQVPAGRLQVRLQQSASPVQAPPAAAQNWAELQWWVAALHAVEQQSALVEQLSPPGWQAF